MNHDKKLASGFRRLRFLRRSAQFGMPLFIVTCATLAMHGQAWALPLLSVFGLVWLATRTVVVVWEWRRGIFADALDMGAAMSLEIGKHISQGKPPDTVIGTAFGVSLGMAVAHFGWTPAQAREAVGRLVVEFSEQKASS